MSEKFGGSELITIFALVKDKAIKTTERKLKELKVQIEQERAGHFIRG
jgi:hypothetical protein